jgi:hypothetical protein
MQELQVNLGCRSALEYRCLAAAKYNLRGSIMENAVETEIIIYGEKQDQTSLFTCPKCGGHELNQVVTNQILVQPVTIEDGQLEYEEEEFMDDPDPGIDSEWRFECGNPLCRFVPRDENGDPIVEIVEWCEDQSKSS